MAVQQSDELRSVDALEEEIRRKRAYEHNLRNERERLETRLHAAQVLEAVEPLAETLRVIVDGTAAVGDGSLAEYRAVKGLVVKLLDACQGAYGIKRGEWGKER